MIDRNEAKDARYRAVFAQTRFNLMFVKYPTSTENTIRGSTCRRHHARDATVLGGHGLAPNACAQTLFPKSLILMSSKLDIPAVLHYSLVSKRHSDPC